MLSQTTIVLIKTCIHIIHHHNFGLLLMNCSCMSLTFVATPQHPALVPLMQTRRNACWGSAVTHESSMSMIVDEGKKKV
jgi:hypothetical protein